MNEQERFLIELTTKVVSIGNKKFYYSNISGKEKILRIEFNNDNPSVKFYNDAELVDRIEYADKTIFCDVQIRAHQYNALRTVYNTGNVSYEFNGRLVDKDKYDRLILNYVEILKAEFLITNI